MLANEERFPAKCWDVKTRLEEMKNHGEDYLSEEQYMDVCNAHGVEDPAEQQKLLRRLADLGTVVSFPDDVKLAELSVLNPEWATDGIYRVVTDEPLREERHGQLQCKALRNLLPRDRWPKPKHLQYMLDLMEKFELCFYVGEGNETVLVPELLPDKTPPLADWNAKQCVVFLYQYPVLPHGVLPRFITRTHQLSEGRERWRSGVELADDSAEALIKADYDANKVSVWVRGPHADARRGLLKVVRHHFGSIHARIRELNPNELVALKDHPDVLQSYSDLVKDERRGKTTVAVTINDERLDRPIADFLDCIERPATRREAAERDKSGRTFYLATGAVYHEHEETMSQDDHSIHIGGNVTNSQVGQTLSKCNITIQEQAPGERKDLLEALSGKVKRLLEQLPPEKQDEAPQVAENLAMLVKQATASKPNRPWYDVSAKGLLEASKFVKDFSGNIAGTIGQLGRLIWPDFQLPQ